MIKRFYHAVTRVSVWMLILVTAVPAPLLAQTQGGSGFPSLGAAGGAGSGLKDSLPGSPVVTNPTALQPLAPPQTPCPPLPAKTPPAIAPTGPTLNDFWPSDSSAVLPPSADTRIRLERDERFKKEQREDIAKQKQDDRITTDIDVRSKQEREERGRLAQQTAQLTSKDYSVEEAFAQFSVLQNVKSRLHQFGYDFFDTQATSFAPVLDTPVGPDYVLGPLDSLSIHVWNVPEQSLNRSYIVPVERDGMIVIPQIGAIPVGGLTFSQAERAITNRLSAHLKRFEVHVAMARLRTIKVYVVGEVVRPGAYEISSLATVSNALYAACGPARSGSLRQIRLVRDNQALGEIDFYQFLMAGDRRQDARLQSGDVIVVPPLGPIAAVSGAVKRAAIYELNPGTRLVELLQLAGGVTPSANLQRCQLLRLDQDKGRIMIDIDLGKIIDASGRKRPTVNGADLALQDGDFLRVASVPTQVVNVVTLAGAVKNPGPYEFRPGMAVRDILKADQFTVDAYMDKAEIVRTNPLTYETKVISFSPKDLFDNGKADDIPLQRMDQIVVGTQMRPPSVVFVEGEVRRPGYFTLETGEKLSSILKRAGGFSATAFPEGIVLVRESVRKRQQVELDRFLASERQRLTAQSAALAAGTVGMSTVGAAAGQAAEQQVLSLRLQQLEAVTARVELGRVVINVRSLEELESSEDDIMLESKDRIAIPQPPKTVSVIGSVKNPSTVVYRVGLNLEDYVQQSGGMTEDASKSEMYVVKANGSTEGAYVRIKDMKPGDTIVIPQKIEAKTPQLSLWQSVASIVGSVALAAAGIAVIGR
ncbi:MAG TPA: SLBB domain-containing protein [Terriglobales bacterium]|nr:SLBB domain-containing protein [Terriglobales bacterium]